MSLRLLVDEDTQSRWLVRLLRDAGHDVATVSELGLQGRPDPDVLARAIADDRMVLTRNVDDFRELHMADANHSGIAGIFFDSDPSNRRFVPLVERLELVGSRLPPTRGQARLSVQAHRARLRVP